MLLPFVALVLVFAMSYAPLLGWSYAFVGYTLDANLANLRFSVQALAAQLTPVEADAFEHKGTGSFASDKYFRKVYNVNKYPHHGGYMKQTLDLLKFSAKIGRADCARAESVRLSCGRDEMMRFCWDAPNPVDWPDAKYLVCDVTGDRDWSQVFIFEFWDREGGHDAVYPDLTVRMSVLPKVKTRLCLPLRALDAQSIFLPRTRGQLRSFITGSAVARDRIETFAIGMREGPAEQGITVEGLYLTDELPDFPLPDVKLVDSLGQNKLKDWAGKTHSEREMVDALRAEFAAVTDSGAAAATAAATAAVARPGAAAAPREAHS
ncbi:MAG: hypothetical protein LBU58_01795, partial [Clostridiales bacterium]|nr:hypothetical protein [Clostridiales bacterium]